jgi:hypothetical protein
MMMANVMVMRCDEHGMHLILRAFPQQIQTLLGTCAQGESLSTGLQRVIHPCTCDGHVGPLRWSTEWILEESRAIVFAM